MGFTREDLTEDELAELTADPAEDPPSPPFIRGKSRRVAVRGKRDKATWRRRMGTGAGHSRGWVGRQASLLSFALTKRHNRRWGSPIVRSRCLYDLPYGGCLRKLFIGRK